LTFQIIFAKIKIMDKILGYTKEGLPIYTAAKGSIVTKAFILCGLCDKVISFTGGPKWGSLCVGCHEYQQETRLQAKINK
jgi:hypothetical protein